MLSREILYCGEQLRLFFKPEPKPTSVEDREKLNQQIELMGNLVRTDGRDKLSPESDNIVRKIQLFDYKQSPRKQSLVYEIARHYLYRQGARILQLETSSPIIIKYPDGKKATMKRLTVLNDGRYNSSSIDLWNFPVLISWPRNKTGFEAYSFSDIINNPPANFQDKIVIVGSMDDRSLFKVPIAVGDNRTLP